MNSIFIIRESDHAWLRRQFRGRHPMLATLCNKPFIEYLVDFAILAGSRAIRIATDGPISAIEQYCGDGGCWGIEVSYSHILPEDGMERILEKNRKFCTEGRTMILERILFIDYDKRFDYKAWAAEFPEGERIEAGGAAITILGRPYSNSDGPMPDDPAIEELSGIGDYYRLSKRILNAGERFILPGYSNEAGCFIGRNVTIQKGAEIRKPVMIGNNVQIMEGTVIGPETVIGCNVIVDRSSTVAGSILMNNTFVGEELEVNRKIAEGNMLVDPQSGATLLMEDPHLMSAIDRPATGTELARRVVHAMAAALLIALQALPYLILRPLLGRKNNWKSVPVDSAGRTKSIRTAEVRAEGLSGRIALALAIDRFPLLFRVLDGSLRLIGHRLQEGEASLAIDGGGMAAAPAVFAYAESEEWPQSDADSLIVDHYHAIHSTPLGDVGLTLKALVNRKKA